MQYYYAKVCPWEVIYDLVRMRTPAGYNKTRYREFAFNLKENVMSRFNSFESALALKRYVQQHSSITKYHLGAQYTADPKRRNSEGVVDEFKELVFDIDLDDYSALLGSIDPSDMEACDRFWSVVGLGMDVLKHVLRARFGFRHFLVCYSGRRGAHLCVYDEKACAASNEVRSAIVSNIKFDADAADMDEVYRELIEPFWKEVALRSYHGGGFGVFDTCDDVSAFLEGIKCKRLKDHMANHVSEVGLVAWQRMCEYSVSNRHTMAWLSGALKREVARRLWPHVDTNVTTQMKHLAKGVFSVHPSTGRVCVPIFGRCTSFVPQCQSIDVRSIATDQSREAVDALVDQLRSFVKGMDQIYHQSLNTYGMTAPSCRPRVSKKRPRHDDDDDCVAQQALMFGTFMRTFVAVSNPDRPQDVYITMSTCPESKEAGAASPKFDYANLQHVPNRRELLCNVGTLYKGSLFPLCAKRDRRFHAHMFEEAVRRAHQSPGSNILCDSMRVLILRNLPDSRENKERFVDRLQEMMQRMVSRTVVCKVNCTWDRDAIVSYLNSSNLCALCEDRKVYI